MTSLKVSYADCISELVPGAQWTIDDNNYSSLIWMDNTYTKPTKDEIKAKKIELENGLPMKILRIQRDQLLEESDKYVLIDYPHTSDTTKAGWITYRQQLRNLPTTQSPTLSLLGELENVTWPTKPE